MSGFTTWDGENKTAKILVVEDEQIVALDIKHMLTNRGFDQVRTAGSGQEAIDQVRKWTPDLVLMDIMLTGEMDGIDAAVIILEDLPVPIIYITALTSSTVLERAKKTDPAGYLIKPFNEADLNAAVQIALHGAEKEKEILRLNRFLHTVMHSMDNPFYIIDTSDYGLTISNLEQEANETRLRCYQVLYGLDRPCHELGRVCPLKSIVQTGCSTVVEQETTDTDGSKRQIEVYGYPVFDENGAISHIIGYRLDVTKRRRMEQALRESEERYALAANAANDGLWDWNLENNHIYYSPRWKNMLGYKEAEISDRPDEWIERVHPEDKVMLQNALDAHLSGYFPVFSCEYRIRDKSGMYRWMQSRGLAVRNQDEKAVRIAGSQNDIHERKRAEEQLLQHALYDDLTGLPNRALLLDRLKLALTKTKRETSYRFGLLFLDLDGFRTINESMGHSSGDVLLQQLAKRLKGCMRAGDTLSRIGGDEFVFLLDGVGDVAGAVNVVTRIQTVLKQPFPLNQRELFLNASIGLILSSDQYTHPEEMLRDADTALYQAKSRGRGSYAVFDDSMHSLILTQLDLEADLRRAIEQQEFVLYYQPLIDTSSGTIHGFEALIRWQHPQQGLISPMSFIPLAEKTGLIIPIGEWALRTACGQLKQWHDLGLSHLKVAVNFSAVQLRRRGNEEIVSRALQESGLSGSSLVVEVTESATMNDVSHSTQLFDRLHEMGVRIAIDDFGTGYSSLEYLSRFSIESLKVDRSFVRDIPENRKNLTITRSIIALAHNLGLSVTAEGVETPTQYRLLHEYGCERMQGYLFSKPVDAPAAGELLQRGVTHANHLQEA